MKLKMKTKIMATVTLGLACRQGVGNNSILCFCKLWVHKRCSDMKGKLKSVADKCRKCTG